MTYQFVFHYTTYRPEIKGYPVNFYTCITPLVLHTHYYPKIISDSHVLRKCFHSRGHRKCVLRRGDDRDDRTLLRDHN